MNVNSILPKKNRRPDVEVPFDGAGQGQPSLLVGKSWVIDAHALLGDVDMCGTANPIAPP